MSTNKVNISSYKGVRDFYPEDMLILDYIQSVWHAVLQSYGYEHYSASILEPSEIYENKTSDEIVNEQTYTFTDRGNRRVTLRPEMTPTLARMVAQKQRELNFPLRWYSIPNVFRYERPQKGRLREHWQLNVDILGLENLEAEAEVIEISVKIMEKFGLKQEDYVVKINDRKILNELMDGLRLAENQKKEFLGLLDRKDKINNFDEQMEKLIGRPFNQTISPNESIKKLLEKIKSRGIQNIVFDPLLVRGFDYYTGVVFELFDTDEGNSRALFGGGRYNNLLGLFGGDQLPAVGFGMGDVALKEALESRGLLPKQIAVAHLAICTIGSETFEVAAQLASELRSVGVDVVVNYDDKKVGDQIKRASKKGIPFVLCLGQEEMDSGKFKLKNLLSGEEKSFNKSSLIAFLKEKL